MNLNLIASLFYFALFAGLGYARGLRREALVLGASAGGLGALALAESQAAAEIVRSLSQGQPAWPSAEAFVPDLAWPQLRDQLQQQPLPLALWTAVCGGAYWLSQTRVHAGRKPRRVLGAAASAATGALFLEILAPLLSRDLLPLNWTQNLEGSGEFTAMAWELLEAAQSNRNTVLTVAAIAAFVYLVSRRRKTGN